MTRREFLQLLGQAGGASLVYSALGAMGLSDARGANAPAPFKQLEGNANGKRVLILGAGAAGLCVAYELGKVGYDCKVLEARTRVGGRCHTIRRGTTEIETDGRSQTCAFDEDPNLYFNPGPTRIAQQHCTLDYCRELGVAVEVFGNLNEAAYLYRSEPGALSGQRVRVREARGDLYGYVAELLAKAVHAGALDQDLTAADKQNLLHYLTVEGALHGGDFKYRGSNRRGYSTWPAAGDQRGARSEPFKLADVLGSELGHHFSFNWGIEQQSTMLTIVGGMDRLPREFAQRVGSNAIELGARVTEIRQTPERVLVRYADRVGRAQEAAAEYCVCTIPPKVLRGIDADFSDAMRRAIASVEMESAVKVGLQFKRRFWEEDDRIFSGISRTDQTIQQIIYPSCGYLGKKGVVIGCYNFAEDAEEMSRLSSEARVERALADGEKIHPQYRAEFESGFAVSWRRTPFSLGAYALYPGDARRQHYPTLCEPDRRIYLAGEHVSWLNGWIAGALESARRAATMIHERTVREKSP